MIINHPLLGPRDSEEFVYLGAADLINRPSNWEHDASAEVHKMIVGDDIIMKDERKKEEEDVNTGTGGKVHLGRDVTGEHHVVVLGPTPKAILESVL